MIRCVGGITHDATGRLLLIRRGLPPGRGLWSLPGGRVRPGETDVAAVIRELREETGLTVRPGALVGRVERPAPDGVYVIHDYSCRVTGGQMAAGDDADDVAWVDLTTFYRLDRTGALTEALAETLRRWNALPTH